MRTAVWEENISAILLRGCEVDGTHFSYMEVLNMVHHVCEDADRGYSSMYFAEMIHYF